MKTLLNDIGTYVYTFNWEPNEEALSALERRTLFGIDTNDGTVESTTKIDPSRSPFIKERIGIICEGESIEELIQEVKGLEAFDGFKIVFVQNPDLEKVGFKKLRKIEKEVGLHLKGEADLDNPSIWLGILNTGDRWILGEYSKNEAVWLRHQWKPNSYSTALGTRVARAVVNIAAPETEGVKLIDPCCGIGTVLVEARSMGIDIIGSDRNPLILSGVRENLAYFGLDAEVSLKDIREVTGQYDAAIIDLPYNLCSVITVEEQLEMLQSARRFASKVVIVSVEDVDDVIGKAGFEITDRCEVSKGRFVRQVIVCE
ncbi:RsmD family RNA methyltransferase [Rossellomorea aquimaris]|uniref:TRM11 family SAM-dependent methyltransferase n=1 Tax=Rossellomorea aquimaris TaxID=189382 RepID=UPI001CD5B10C|nr:RsmD family RNA methyltransferase [Rossellomorea aquimaris]MCA1055726.1 RsmD family RNA methyltransferase [Rossellomorea aquimaris]